MTPEMICELKRKRYNATLVSLQKVHSDLLIARVQPDTPHALPTPGQYVVLGLGYWEPRFPGSQEENIDPAEEHKLISRSYSISCPILDSKGELFDPVTSPWHEFYIVLVREAEKEPPALTPRLFMLRENDRLFFGKKITGHYTLEGVREDDTILFLATGTGEAPHNYMLWDLLRRGHRGPILSATCVRQQRDHAYRATHEELMRRYPRYSFLPLTTREPANAGQKVYIQDVITSGQLEERLGEKLDPARTHVFLCGNPKMIGLPTKDRETEVLTYPQTQGVVEILVKRGFVLEQRHLGVRGSIHFEEYW
jgi:ferredoxin--NADP+ reductase